MFTDMVGYSALARDNEQMARELVDAQRKLIRDALKRHHGREHQTTGDGFFLEFASAVNAVQCAIDIQTAMHDRERFVPENRRIKIRIGIHLGDILTDDQDVFGNGVNVAARVEPLAKPGGICITRQIYDQVSERITGVQFKSHGRRDLKNIRGGAEIFHVVLPWDKNTKARARAHTFGLRFLRGKISTVVNNALITTVTFACLASLVYTMGGAIHASLKTDDTPSRLPAQVAEPVDLASGWSFRTSPDATWEEFETHASWKHAEKIEGVYWMMRTFRTTGEFKEPAIVLGLITDTHRLFLNGKFIGGSDHPGELAYYTFSPDMLRRDADNVLVIEGQTRRALNPGLIVLPKVGASLGEFTDIHSRVRENEVKFHMLRNTYFGLSLLIFVAAFGFSIFRRSSMHYLYSSVVLLLGVLGLAYYSPWISRNFEYPFLRFLKVISLTHIPIFLLSARLRLIGRPRLEMLNNALSLICLIGVAIGLLGRAQSPTDFIKIYNLILISASLYAFAAGTWIVYDWVREPRRHKPGLQIASVVFAALSSLAAFCAVKTNMDPISTLIESLTTAQFRLHATEMGMSLPFLFSLFLVAVATFDYREQSRAARHKLRRDKLMLELVRLMGSTQSFQDVIASVQRQMCDFLKAERSTLYVLESDTAALSADYVHLNRLATFEIKQKLSIHEGIIGYVLTHQTPLFLPDIRRDRRFFGEGAAFAVAGFESYRTGSCMLYPLFSQGRIVGVITFADKKEGPAFTLQDFEVALELSSTLGLLVDNQQMRRKIDALNVA